MTLTEIEKQIATDVLNRFLSDKKPTARKPLSTKFKDPYALNLLVERSVLRANNQNNLFLPMVVAFHFCADETTLRVARKSVSVVVNALQDLFSYSTYDFPQFTPAEIEVRARQKDGEVTADLIRLGLYLAQEFGVFGGWTPAETEPPEFKSTAAIEFKSVGANEYILTHENVEGLWDQRIKQWTERFEPAVKDGGNVAANEQNILLSALRVFCTDVEMESLLVHPHKVTRKLDVSAGFELRVGWLLGLFGFSTIILGDYEHLVVPETKARRGSVDILAAHRTRKLLLAVACTTAPPKMEDFGNVRNVREIVLREAGFAGTDVRVIPVMFAATRGGPLCDRNGTECVPIVDTDRLKEFLGLIWQGREEPLFEFLEEPDPELPRAITGWGFRDRENDE